MANWFFLFCIDGLKISQRVYDEDVTQEEATTEESTAKKEKTKEEREAELVPKVTMAMKLGLGVIESAFEKLDMNEANSDSEDEEVCYKGDALLEAKVSGQKYKLEIENINYIYKKQIYILEYIVNISSFLSYSVFKKLLKHLLVCF